MTGWTRRRFLGASAAAGCVGCGEATGSSSQGVTAVESSPLVSRADPAGGTPARPTGFGSAVRVGPLAELLERIDAEGAAYVPEAQDWLSRYPADAVAAARDVYDADLHAGLEVGIVALFQKCPHLGCRVPFCETSGWFECPCHGSRYTAAGEHRSGPGPRGMDLFPVRIEAGDVVIDTSRLVSGLPLGTVVVDQPMAGPSCVGLDEH